MLLATEPLTATTIQALCRLLLTCPFQWYIQATSWRGRSHGCSHPGEPNSMPHYWTVSIDFVYGLKEFQEGLAVGPS